MRPPGALNAPGVLPSSTGDSIITDTPVRKGYLFQRHKTV